MKRFLKILLFIIIAAGVAIGSVLTIRAVNNRGAAPVAHWKFDEGSSNHAYDSSGNANTGTLTNMDTSAAWVNGEYGTALQFDGSNDYVSAGDIFYSNTLTISAWIYPTVLDANAKTIVAKRNNPGVTASTMEWFFYHSSSKLAFAATASGGVTDVVAFSGTSNLSLNTWQFASVTCDGSKCYMYLNGKLDGSGDQTGIIGDTASLVQIGARTSNNDNRYFTGSIDDVRVYNYARTADQIKTDYNAGRALYVGARAAASCDVDPASCINKGLVGYWDMDQMGGTTATDKSGNGNTGTFASSPVWTGGIQPFSGGKPGGGALKFDGSDDYVNINSVIPDVASATAGTISFWFKPTLLKDYEDLIGFSNGGGNHQLRLIANAAGTLLGVTYKDAQKWTFGSDAPVFSVGTWAFITLVQNGTSPVAYVNGKLIPITFTQSADKTYWFSNDPFADAQIGTMSGVDPTQGFIDDVRIYNRALSAAEIQYQYNQGDPIAYWSFAEGSGSSTYDSSGNANTGTLVNPNASTMWASGVYGTGLQFDGSDDYVTIPHSSSLVFGTSSFSVSLWTYRTAAGFQGGSYFRKGVGYPYPMNGIDTYDNSFHIYTTTGKLASVRFSATIGVWEHHVFTVTQNSTPYIKHYINGVFNNTGYTEVGNLGPINSDAYPFIIGYSYAGGVARYFGGSIDDFRIYNYARSADQARADYNAGKAMYVGTRITDCDESPADCVNKGLVGYWDMDQMGGTTATDKSGNGNTGTLGGGTASAVPTWIQGIQPFSGGKAGGGALKFDGGDDYVSVADNNILDLTNVGTISAWIKPAAIGSYMTPLSKGRVDIWDDVYSLWVGTNGVPEIYYAKTTGGNSGIHAVGTVMTAGTWYHIVGTWDGTNVKFYQNGVLKDTKSQTFNQVVTDNILTIGSTEVATTYPFNGPIDDVRIYNRALTAAEISYQYNQAKPIAWWKMDSVGVSGTPGTALNVYDNSGNANTGVSSGETMNNGTISGAVWKSGPNCKYGSCLSFDGTDDYVKTATNFSNAANSPMTLSAWVNSNVITNDGAYSRRIILPGGNQYFSLTLSSGKLTAYYYNGSQLELSDSVVVSTGVWYHVVGAYDGTTMRLYANGVLKNSVVTTLNAIVSGPIRIGIYSDEANGRWSGSIDDVRIYNTALTDAQVAALYNNNDRSAGASLEGNLVGEWRFDEMGTSYVVDTHYQRIGKYGYAMNFDGSNDYVDMGSGSSIHPTKYITISVWVKPGSTQITYADILGNHAVGGLWNGYTIQQSGSTLNLFGFSYGNGSTWQGGTVLTQLTANQWNHYVVQKNDTVLKSYLNGVLVGQENVTGDIVYAATHPIYIGVGYTGLTRYFNGLIDDVRIYNYARSADQIKQDYNQGAAVRFGPLEGLP